MGIIITRILVVKYCLGTDLKTNDYELLETGFVYLTTRNKIKNAKKVID